MMFILMMKTYSAIMIDTKFLSVLACFIFCPHNLALREAVSMDNNFIRTAETAVSLIPFTV